MEFVDAGIYNDKYRAITYPTQMATLSALGNGLHQVLVFPLMSVTNLVGRRASYVKQLPLFFKTSPVGETIT